MLALAFGLLLPHVGPSRKGMVTFVCVSIFGFVFCLFAGAYLTADAISSEKRSGTLGLLFLTPLKAWQIVVGKALMHSVQVGWALVGVFPVFFIPILLGGVSWSEIVRVLLVLLVTLLLSIVCGIFWSTFVREARAAVFGTAVSMILLTLLPHFWSLFREIFPNSTTWSGVPQLSPVTQLIYAFQSVYAGNGTLGTYSISGPVMYWSSVSSLLLLIVVLLVVAASCLSMMWRYEESSSGAPVVSFPALVRARFVRRSRGRSSAFREGEHLLWLAGRDLREASGPALFGLMGIVVLLVIAGFRGEKAFIVAFLGAYVLHVLTRIQLSLAATRRWSDDRNSGALETLLATPVSDAEVVTAHHRALTRAFRGSVWGLIGTNLLLQLSLILLYEPLRMDEEGYAVFSALFLGGAILLPADFAAVRWLGFREGIRNPTHLRAARRVFGSLVAFAWPAFGVVVLMATNSSEGSTIAFWIVVWALACLLIDLRMAQRCRAWLAVGLRRRIAGDPG